MWITFTHPATVIEVRRGSRQQAPGRNPHGDRRCAAGPDRADHQVWTGPAALDGAAAGLVGVAALLHTMVTKADTVRVTNLFYCVPPVTAALDHLVFKPCWARQNCSRWGLVVITLVLIQGGPVREPPTAVYDLPGGASTHNHREPARARVAGTPLSPRQGTRRGETDCRSDFRRPDLTCPIEHTRRARWSARSAITPYGERQYTATTPRRVFSQSIADVAPSDGGVPQLAEPHEDPRRGAELISDEAYPAESQLRLGLIPRGLMMADPPKRGGGRRGVRSPRPAAASVCR